METQLMNQNSPPSLSTTTTPYTTAPSSPHRLPNFFYSAPTSPIHSLAFQPNQNDHDFAFHFTGQPEPPSISAADELFHCGKIKPLSKPISPQKPPLNVLSKRQRETTATTTTSTFKISDILSDDENNINQKNTTWYNKWNIKNLLLFRSTSEGSASRSKDQINKFNKYSRIKKGEHVIDVKNSSFKSTESKRGVMTRKVSAHEIHYTANRAVAEEMKRKTYLPYKSGLFGCLGFHNINGAPGPSGSVHEISRGITSVIKQRGY
ncbi:uncharacterized protein [Rutidosis leptorrhynchoides]|uniref:uncharacterized protein n=1 Tax=Rutidosis leptorrhynchoides TaxID=125765 RepID=UPI003A994CF3